MHEDWTIEAELFPRGSRVFCIASSGCTALALAARGDRVTAVDVNPAQIDYVRQRAAGAPRREGRVERGLRRGRRVMRWLGVTEFKLRMFLAMHDPTEQLRFWREELDTRRWRLLLAFALSPLTLRMAYASEFVRALPHGFDGVIRRRLERGWGTHPNRTNPYAWQILLGCDPQDREPGRAPSAPVTLCCADVAEFLLSCPAASFDGLSLSNILDGTDPAYRPRLWEAVRHAAAPGAVVLLRSFAEPSTADENYWAARDRALLWGSVRVERLHAQTSPPVECALAAESGNALCHIG
jgi:S-adenosylmethionine:diacylglycerol 3-amino-3-carboxypropyl transferase